jgi:O-antigen biosynthesis protein
MTVSGRLDTALPQTGQRHGSIPLGTPVPGRLTNPRAGVLALPGKFRPTKVSIIIPYYNHGSELHAAVQSSLAAYDGDLEVIVVNDGSAEPHAAVYLDLVRRLSVKVSVITKRNGGLSSARNAGLAAANGDFIQFLDSDDVLLPEKITRQVKHFSVREDLQVSVCDYFTGNEWLSRLDKQDSIAPYKFAPESFLFLWERRFSIPMHVALFRRSVFDDIKFDESVVGKEDWILWCKLIRQWPHGIAYMPFRGAVYRLHKQGMTRSLDAMGESWLRATSVIGELWSERYPEFEAASAEWHARHYRGARLKLPCALEMSSATTVEATEDCAARAVNVDSQTVVDIRPAAVSSSPLISFIVPIYNHAKYLGECLTSILQQNFRNIELIAIDDASSEQEVGGILGCLNASDLRIKCLRNSFNLGIAHTQNLAAREASGTYLAFVDCDDFIPPHAAKTVADAIAQFPGDYYFSDMIDIDQEDKPLRKAVYGGYDWLKPSGDVRRDLILGMVASHLKVIRREAFLAQGGCRPEFSGVQDWDLALRVARHGTLRYIPEPLYFRRVHNNSVTSACSIGQFWLANRLRREALAWFSSDVARAADDGEEKSVRVIDGFETSSLISKLLEPALRGLRLIFQIRGRSLSVREIDLLREFNSFFDRIDVGSTEAAALMGYLWDEQIVSMSNGQPALYSSLYNSSCGKGP